MNEAAPIQPYVHVNEKKAINTNLNVLCVVVLIKALSTGDKKYSNKYAFMNQLRFVAKIQPANPFNDNSFTPISSVIMYNPVKKKRH